MPARIAAADFRNYIKKNFALEGGQSLKDYHIGGIEKAMRGHAKLGSRYHAPGLEALRQGNKADAVSQERAFSLTKNLRDAVQKGEINLDGKKLEIAHGFKGIKSQGELRSSIRAIGAGEAAAAAAKADAEKPVMPKARAAIQRKQSVIQNILGIGTPERPGSAQVSVSDKPGRAPQTSSLGNIERRVGVGDTNAAPQTSVGRATDGRPTVGGAGIGTAEPGATAIPGEQTAAPASADPTVPAPPSTAPGESPATPPAPMDSQIASAEDVADVDAPDQPTPSADSDTQESPPPAADDELMI